MDPYASSYGPSSSGGTPASRLPVRWVLILAFLVVVAGGGYMYMKRTTKKDAAVVPTETGAPSSRTAKKTKKTPKTTSGGSGGGGSSDDDDVRTAFEKEQNWASDAPITRLADFAFESKTRPGYVPTAKGGIAPKPAGNPPYKFVACEASASYAVRWNGRYLTVKDSSTVRWTEERQEPGSCFKIVPGFCGAGDGYVMLRSVANKSVLRADEASGMLVCKDIPTARTAAMFCWKLNPAIAKKQPCGQQYSYDLGRIVDVPCDVQEMPRGDASCSTVTRGYQAKCCIRKGPNTHRDGFCETTIFPKVVGQSLQQALLYIRTRRPDLILKPCPEPCTTQAIPEQYPDVVIVPYDARSGVVTSIPRRLV